MRILYFVVFTFLLCSKGLLAQNQGVASSKGVDIHYQCFGTGEPLLIINGGPGFSSEGFVPLAKKLSEKYMTIVYDQRGTGKSAMNVLDTNTITMDLMVADIEAVREALQIESWTVLGHSFGGMMANYYISKHPEKVNGLIASSSGGVDLSLLEYAENGVSNKLTQLQRDSVSYWRSRISEGDTSYPTRLGLARNMAPAYVYKQSLVPQVAERLTQGNMMLNRLVWQNLRLIQFDTKAALRNFKKPVLVIHGKDDVLDPEIAQIAMGTYPNAELLMLENCRHYGWLDQPEQYFEAVYSFLERI